MLQPKRTKYRKSQRGNLKGTAKKGSTISFGTYGLKAVTRGLVTSRQIEAARQTMARFIKRSGKIWIRIFPHQPFTKSGEETPMGSGKGAVDYYACKVLPGRVLFEIDGIEEATAREAMRLAGHKLPVKTKFITKLI
jgi:large subunit ribosomal protein L16